MVEDIGGVRIGAVTFIADLLKFSDIDCVRDVEFKEATGGGIILFRDFSSEGGYLNRYSSQLHGPNLNMVH